MKTFLFVLVYVGLCPYVSAQDFFIKTYGGEGTQRGRCVRQTSDGGYIIAGYTYQDSQSDAYLIKTDAGGNVIWEEKFGGENDQEASCVQIVENGYIFSGLDWVSGDEFQTYLVLADQDGNPSWEKTQSLTLNNSGNDLELTADGGYASIGSWSFYPELQTMVFLKYNDQGDITEEKTLNYTDGSEYGNSLVAVDSDQGFGYAILATTSFDPWTTTGDDMFLVRLDENGDTLWTKKYAGEEAEKGVCIQQTPDKGFILAGSSTSYGNGSWDALLIKTDSEGNQEWMQTYGGDDDELLTHVENTSDGGFILTGYRENDYPNYDIYVVKTDSQGDTIWTRSVDVGRNDRGRWIEQTSDGAYILTGYSELTTGDEEEVCLVKLNSQGIVIGGERMHKKIPEVHVYQNLIHQTVTLDYEIQTNAMVSLSLYNINGQKIRLLLNETQDSGQKTLTWSTKGIFPGIYIGSLTINEIQSNFKLILY